MNIHKFFFKPINTIAFTQDMLNTQFNDIPKSVSKESKNIEEQLTKIDNNNFILINLFHDFIKVKILLIPIFVFILFCLLLIIMLLMIFKILLVLLRDIGNSL